MIRMLVCDDHVLMCAGLTHVFSNDERFGIVGEANTRQGLLDRLHDTENVDVALVDLSLEGTGVASGIALIEEVHALRRDLPIVVLSVHDEAEIVGHALQAGARGYVTKDSAVEVLADAILQVYRGHHFLSPNLVEPMVRHRAAATEAPWDADLTPREREVMTLICRGQRLSEIAVTWGVSIKTVSTHKVRMMDKLKIANNAELIKLGVRIGLT